MGKVLVALIMTCFIISGTCFIVSCTSTETKVESVTVTYNNGDIEYINFAERGYETHCVFLEAGCMSLCRGNTFACNVRTYQIVYSDTETIEVR